MQIKKELIVVVCILLIVLQVINIGVILMFDGQTLGDLLTGDAASVGTTSICINHPPTITAVSSQTATAGTAYSLQITASDTDSSDTLTYADNSSLFNISSSGLISFTPVAGDIGDYTTLITVSDNSGCTNYQNTVSFALSIVAATSGTPTTETSAAAGGGGGGGGGTAKSASFFVSEDILKVALKQSKKLEKKIIIRNDELVNMDFKIFNPLKNILIVDPIEFNLGSGEEKEIKFIFNFREQAVPNVYFGEIKITGDTGAKISQKKITTVIEVESEEILYDSSIDIAKKTIGPGENLRTTISVFDIKRQAPSEITLFYTILDMENNVILQGDETINIEGQASFTKEFVFPKPLAEGQYLLTIKIPFGESFATATELFSVELPKDTSALAGLAAPISRRPSYVLAIPLMVLAIVVISVLLFFIHKRNKNIRPGKTIIKLRTVVKPKTIIQRVFQRDNSETRKKLSLLKEGYKKGYIKEETYKNTKAKLEKLMG